MSKPAKPAKKAREPRACCVCGRLWRGYELEPYGWDVILAAGDDGEPALLSTCSQACRQKRGWPERQMGLFVRGDK